MAEITRYKLDAAFAQLHDFDYCTDGPNAFIEVSLWRNGEGFDVTLSSAGEQRFGLTWGQFKAVKKILKELDH